MTTSRVSIVALALFILCVTIGGQGFADDDKDKKAKKEDKPAKDDKPTKVEEVTSRAMAWGKKHHEEYGDVVTITAFPCNALEKKAYTAILEFGMGVVVVYQGTTDSDEDNWVVLEKDRIETLKCCLDRAWYR